MTIEKKKYSIQGNNCQHFVDSFLKHLKIEKSWTRKGIKPIRTFISNMNDVSRDNFELSFFNITKSIKNHNDLKDYWDLIQEPIRIELEIDPIIAMEIVDLIKSLERGYIARDKDVNMIEFGYYYNTDGTPKHGVTGMTYAISNVNRFRNNTQFIPPITIESFEQIEYITE